MDPLKYKFDAFSPLNIDACLAVILVGGQGKRLGGVQKGMIRINGKRIIESQIDIMRHFAATTAVLGIDKNQIHALLLEYPEVLHWPDLQEARSPLSGIQAALYASAVPWVWIFANDMPNITHHHCQQLSQSAYQYYLKNKKYPLVTFYHDQWAHPLAALWHRHAFTYLPMLNSKHLSLQKLCKQIPHLAIPSIEGNSLCNINTMEDLQKFTAFLIDR